MDWFPYIAFTLAGGLAGYLAARRRMARALAAARRASEDKTRLLAAASHDLQQPVTALRAYVDLLAINPRVDAVLPRMTDALDHAAGLLESLLQASALDSGKVAPAPCPVQLRRLMREVVADHRPQAERKGMRLDLGHCIRPGCRGLTVSDPLLVKRILGNLVANAVRHGRGRARLRCSCRDGYTLVFVADTGPGIAAERLPGIFEEYRRGGGGGSGLGLAIVARLAEALGHDVTVRSREGAGTVFMLKIKHCGRT